VLALEIPIIASPFCLREAAVVAVFGRRTSMSNARISSNLQNPSTRQNGLHSELKQAIERFFGDADVSNVVTSQWQPRVDIKEEAQRFVIFADIPGVDPQQIEIHMDRGILSIRGERASESTQEGERYSRAERSRGTFYRRFALPDSANPEAIEARGNHGVLEISIPKKASTTPRRITIQTN
jgi:HSP20 family protein